MSLQKNVAGQKWVVFAFDLTTGAAVTGDAANITANLRLDGGAANAVDDTNPTELEDGYYVFDLTQVETNADNILIAPETTTGNTQVIGIPGAVYTVAPNFNTLAIANNRIDSNAVAISNDTTAADNLELMYDGTGYTDGTAPASRDQVGLLSTGTSSISVASDSAVVTTGTNITGTYADTRQLDLVHHYIEDIGNVIDLYYEFDLGAEGVPSSTTWNGYAQSNGDSFQVFAYNWGLASWDQIGIIPGANGTTAVENVFPMLTAHVGTGVDQGTVRIRFETSDGTALATDRLICSYAIVRQTVGYASGSIWFDPTASNTNTVDYIDGTADNPVSTLAAVSTLSSSLNIRRVTFSPKANVTLTADLENMYISGSGGAVNMGGYSISGTVFDQTALSGSDDGVAPTSTPVVLNAFFINSTIGPHISKRNGILGDTTFTTAGTYIWDNCFSGVAGGSAPSVSFPAGVVNFNLRHYSGGIEFKSMTADTTISFEGFGQIIINASCTGGEIHVRGPIGPVTDNSGGAVTITEFARIAEDTIEAAVDAAVTANTAVTTIDTVVDGIKAVTDNLPDSGALTTIDTGVAAIEVDTQDIQGRLPAALIAGRLSADVTAISGSSTAADNLEVSASTIVVATATGGTTTTITTTDVTEATADHMNGRIVIFTDGALQYQATDITDYSFAAGTATLTVTALTEAPTSEGFVII